MKLGELKKSLSRFPPDMDDTEILVQYADNQGNPDADCLTFVAVANYKDTVDAIILGTWKAADIMHDQTPEKFPPNYKYRPDIDSQPPTDNI